MSEREFGKETSLGGRWSVEDFGGEDEGLAGLEWGEVSLQKQDHLFRLAPTPRGAPYRVPTAHEKVSTAGV